MPSRSYWTSRRVGQVSVGGLARLRADSGRRYQQQRYFARPGNAAEAINDRAPADWAKRKAVNCTRSGRRHRRL